MPRPKISGVREQMDFYTWPEPMSGCWLWSGGLTTAGYGRVRDGGREKYAHRVAHEFATGIPPGALCVLHKCDNRACVNPDHLYLGTRTENSGDMVRRGRAAIKLTKEQVAEIRSENGDERFFAKKYGVCRTTIRNVRAGVAKSYA